MTDVRNGFDEMHEGIVAKLDRLERNAMDVRETVESWREADQSCGQDDPGYPQRGIGVRT